MNRPKIENPKFFELLKTKQIIPDDMIRDLLEELDGNGLDVLATLIQSRVGTKRQLCQIWCDSIGIAHVDLEKSLFQPEVVRKMPERLARQLYAIPVYQMGDTVTVATATPDNEVIKKEIQQLMGSPVNLVFALPQDIEWAIENEYQTNAALFDFFFKIKTSQIFQKDSLITKKKLFEIAGREAVNQFHVSLVLFGITENASEIHIDPTENIAKVYLVAHESIDERISMEKPVYQILSLKLRHMANVDTSQNDRPLYSRIIFPIPGKKLDIQFLSLPTEFGEKIYLKMMDRHPIQRAPALNELFLSRSNIRRIRHSVQAKKGMLLISGPPNSGKTTLAYAMLRELKTENTGVMTVEDNIKYYLKDIDQCQTNPKAGYKRADLLTSCMKMHPQVVYIQNMDDPETAETLLREPRLENFFFIAGLEAGSAFEALEKAGRLGLHPLVSTVINQNCVRRLCDHCKESYKLSPSEIEKMFIWDGKSDVIAYREKGCSFCRQTGFVDRIGVQEVLSVDDSMVQRVNDKTPVMEMLRTAVDSGFKTKAYDAVKKALRGLTTFQEILREGI